MTKINRYSGDLKAFASNAEGSERTIFGSTDQADDLDSNITSEFFRGWGIVGVNENPTKEDFNGLAYTVSQLIAYLHQVGISEWDDEQEFAEYGFCIGSDGRLYQSLVAENIGNDPTTDDGTNWRDVVSDGVADQTEHDNPSGVEKLARLDRLADSPIGKGAIVESDTNDNGSYVRWENGEQVCWDTEVNVDFSESAATFSTPWAAEFIETPSGGNNGQNTSSSNLAQASGSVSAVHLTTDARIQVGLTVDYTRDLKCYAWGFWK